MSAQEPEVDDRVHEIILHELAADEAEAEASEHRWEAARLISEELAAGKSQRALARAIAKSQSHISKMSTAWDRYGSDSPENRPSFQDAYRELSAKPENKPRPESKQQLKPHAAHGNGNPDPLKGEQTFKFNRYYARLTKLGKTITGYDWDQPERNMMVDLLDEIAAGLRS